MASSLGSKISISFLISFSIWFEIKAKCRSCKKCRVNFKTSKRNTQLLIDKSRILSLVELARGKNRTWFSSHSDVFSGLNFGDLGIHIAKKIIILYTIVSTMHNKIHTINYLKEETHLHFPDNNRFELVQFSFGGQPRIFGAGHIATLDCQNHCIHQVLGGLDKWRGRVQTRHYQLTRDVLNICFNLWKIILIFSCVVIFRSGAGPLR